MDSELGSYRYRSNSSGSGHGNDSYSNPVSVPSSASTTSSLQMAGLSLRSSSRGSAGRSVGNERSSRSSIRGLNGDIDDDDDDGEDDEEYDEEDNQQDDDAYASGSKSGRSPLSRRSNLRSESSKSAILADILTEQSESEPLVLDMDTINHSTSTPKSASATKRAAANQRLVYSQDDRYASPTQRRYNARSDSYGVSQLSSISDIDMNKQISPPNSDEAKSTVSKLLELGQLTDNERR